MIFLSKFHQCRNNQSISIRNSLPAFPIIENLIKSNWMDIGLSNTWVPVWLWYSTTNVEALMSRPMLRHNPHLGHRRRHRRHLRPLFMNGWANVSIVSSIPTVFFYPQVYYTTSVDRFFLRDHSTLSSNVILLRALTASVKLHWLAETHLIAKGLFQFA